MNTDKLVNEHFNKINKIMSDTLEHTGEEGLTELEPLRTSGPDRSSVGMVRARPTGGDTESESRGSNIETSAGGESSGDSSDSSDSSTSTDLGDSASGMEEGVIYRQPTEDEDTEDERTDERVDGTERAEERVDGTERAEERVEKREEEEVPSRDEDSRTTSTSTTVVPTTSLKKAENSEHQKIVDLLAVNAFYNHFSCGRHLANETITEQNLKDFYKEFAGGFYLSQRIDYEICNLIEDALGLESLLTKSPETYESL